MHNPMCASAASEAGNSALLHNSNHLSKDCLLLPKHTLTSLNPPKFNRCKQACLNYVRSPLIQFCSLCSIPLC